MTAERIRMGESQSLEIVRSSPEALEVESTWQPGGSPPRAHWHPRQTEHFEVLEGELTIAMGGGSPRVVTAGGSFEVPPQTTHAMWNAGSAFCRARWRITPAHRTEEMFRAIDRKPGKLGMLRMLWTFRNEYRLGVPRG
ncbi:MAG: cupin domain-containing protein [Dehalococcoidia bacterium]|nr:cupin domain-containing protein [Dehalococcoidia bacterium]